MERRIVKRMDVVCARVGGNHTKEYVGGKHAVLVEITPKNMLAESTPKHVHV